MTNQNPTNVKPDEQDSQTVTLTLRFDRGAILAELIEGIEDGNQAVIDELERPILSLCERGQRGTARRERRCNPGCNTTRLTNPGRNGCKNWPICRVLFPPNPTPWRFDGR